MELRLLLRCLLLFLIIVPFAASAQPPAKRALIGISAPAEGATAELKARNFLTSRKDLAIDVAALVPIKVTHFGAERVIHFQQMARGYPVEDRVVAVQLDKHGRIRSVQSDYVPVTLPKSGPDIGEAAARTAASAKLGHAPTGEVRKVVLAPSPNVAELAYRVAVARIPLVQHFYVYVSTRDGHILMVRPAGKDMPR